MSALGHKRTFAMQKVMSALPPKADMCSALAYVRFVPKADTSVFRGKSGTLCESFAVHLGFSFRRFGGAHRCPGC